MAEKTGWSEHFLLWELPLTRLLAYEHCALATREGIWTIKPASSRPTLTAPAIPPGYFDSRGDDDECEF